MKKHLTRLAFGLYVLRRSRDMTQAEVARFLGVAPQTYSGYEKGHHYPSIDKLIKIADLYGITIDRLVGRDTDGLV